MGYTKRIRNLLVLSWILQYNDYYFLGNNYSYFTEQSNCSCSAANHAGSSFPISEDISIHSLNQQNLIQ